MTITLIDHGIWERYTPDTLPDGAPTNALFARRVSDGLDWYAFARNPNNWSRGSLRATASPIKGKEIVQAIVRDESLLFPSDSRLFEILGHDPEDTKPWKAYEQKVLDIAAGTITELVAEVLPVTRVSSAQATSVLFRHGLLELAESIAKNHPYVPVRLFFERSPYWEIDNPYVQAFAEELDLNPAQLQSLFDEAAKL